MLLIIFDLDGTLIETDFRNLREARRKAANFLREKYGVDISPSPPFFMKLFNTIKEISRRTGTDGAIIRRQIYKIIEEYELKNVEKFRPLADLRALFKCLRERGIRIAILTSNSRKFAETVLDKLGIKKYIDLVLTRDDIERPKPFPDGILEICKRLGVKKENTIMIGDTPIDMETAKNAGVRAIGLSFHYTEEELKKKGADLVLNKLNCKELLNVICNKVVINDT